MKCRTSVEFPKLDVAGSLALIGKRHRVRCGHIPYWILTRNFVVVSSDWGMPQYPALLPALLGMSIYFALSPLGDEKGRRG